MPARKKEQKRNKLDLQRVWDKLDSRKKGVVTAEQVLRNTVFLEAECPEFIRGFQDVAKDGRVTKQAFFDLVLGKKTSPRSKDGAAAKADLGVLRQLFEDIVDPAGNELRLSDLVRNRERISKVFPALLENFSDIDLDGSATISWDELRVYAGGTCEWLEFQLDRVIGLADLKQQIRDFHRSVVLDKRRCDAGHEVKTGGKYHMIFQGNPGTGKTSLARIVAQLLHRIGIIRTDLLVEVQRDKLVAEYVGQTGPKTQKAIEEAKQGVLFIDEAYRLSQDAGKSDFGKEAIEQLMGAMNDAPGKAPVMVFAGYPEDMDAFMSANSGLYRRIAYTFDFGDYSSQELGQILDSMTRAAGFCIDPDLLADDYARLAELIEEHTLPEARRMMNGGICERIFVFAKQALDAREALRTLRSAQAPPSLEITEDDIVEACGRIPPPRKQGGPSKAVAGAMGVNAIVREGGMNRHGRHGDGVAPEFGGWVHGEGFARGHSLHDVGCGGTGEGGLDGAYASNATKGEFPRPGSGGSASVTSYEEEELEEAAKDVARQMAVRAVQAEARADNADRELKLLQVELAAVKEAFDAAMADRGSLRPVRDASPPAPEAEPPRSRVFCCCGRRKHADHGASLV